MKRYWILGELGSGEKALSAIRGLRALGYEELDAYTPYPVEGMSEALSLPHSAVRPAGFVAGLGGFTMAYLLQWFANAWNFPINVGNRPAHAPPSFIPISFETLELAAATAIVATFLWLCGLPRLHHPVFDLGSFRTVSMGGFWVSVTTKHPDRIDDIRDTLRLLEARRVEIVEEEEE